MVKRGQWDLSFLPSILNKKSGIREIKVSNTRIPRSVHKCEICGRQFGSLSLKERHMQGHYAKARKDGLVPVFSGNPDTQEFSRWGNLNDGFDA